jgi:hypothetical protein
MATATLSKKKTTAITKTLSDIARAVEAVKNDGLQIFSDAASVGDAVRQGDVVIQFLGSDDVQIPAHIYARVDQPVLQLAPGNTKGSRHCLASADGVEMWLPVQTDEAVAKHVYAKHGVKMPRSGQIMSWRLDYSEERAALEEAVLMAGPIFKLSQPNTVVHPEHGDWQLPCGTYRVIFQRTLDEAQRIQRVLD